MTPSSNVSVIIRRLNNRFWIICINNSNESSSITAQSINFTWVIWIDNFGGWIWIYNTNETSSIWRSCYWTCIAWIPKYSNNSWVYKTNESSRRIMFTIYSSRVIGITNRYFYIRCVSNNTSSEIRTDSSYIQTIW